MHEHSSPHRLHSEHALSLTYDDWLALKQHEQLLASHHKRQQTMRNTVLTLFRQYQADTAYLCWRDDKRRQGCWDAPAQAEADEAADTSAYHLRVSSEGFRQTSSPQFLRWAADKRRREKEAQGERARRQEEQRSREKEEVREQREKAQAEFDKWRTTKTQQLASRRKEQHARRAATTTAAQLSKSTQQQRADELYQQWFAHKHTQQRMHEQLQQRQQQRREATKLDRHKQFEALFPTAIAQYVATVEKWRAEEQAARQRQARRERVRAGKDQRPAKKAETVQRPMSPLDVRMEEQRVSSARLAAGQRFSSAKLPYGASSTASTTTAMSASAVSVAPSLFDSFSSSSSVASQPPLAAAPSTARSAASEPVRRVRVAKRKKAVSRPPWIDDWNDSSTVATRA